jgi:hypothetical protein
MDDDASPHASPFQLRRLVPFLRKFWWLPILTLVLSLGAAAGYVWFWKAHLVSLARMWKTAELRLPDAHVLKIFRISGTVTELL